MRIVPIILLLVFYIAPVALFWSQLSRLAIGSVAAAFLVSLVTHIWVDSVFQSDSIGETRSTPEIVTDMRYSLAAALIAPGPYLAGALAVVWFIEGRPHLGLVALLAAGILAICQFRISLFPVRRPKPVQEPTTHANIEP